ncbi:MAG: hypothetical protein DMG61_02360 [Acidobacteria bacterium]|nr:MAG: hypothetical protein DMG61_02360 [Acidobacteriota bacterium]
MDDFAGAIGEAAVAKAVRVYRILSQPGSNKRGSGAPSAGAVRRQGDTPRDRKKIVHVHSSGAVTNGNR